MGWLAPVLIRAKLLLQHLWITNRDWDAVVDASTNSAWTEFRRQIQQLELLQLPRWLKTYGSSTMCLHGFSDASEKAYAATVYLVSRDEDGVAQSTLLVAKSKVAPIKTVSLPRLELCGALLLCRLLVRVREDLGRADTPLHCWTDSQVVLAWLRGHPSKWKTFVANRVSEILTILPEASWRHVKSSLNPADLATRGVSLEFLLDSSLWWHGPPWLTTAHYPEPGPEKVETSLEERTCITACHASQPDHVESMLARFSSLQRLIRVTAYILRWKRNHKLRREGRPSPNLDVSELQVARYTLIKAVQAVAYESELSRLLVGHGGFRSSSIRSLSPFVDKDGILRVGGRLQYSFLAYQEKHPAILPGNSHLSHLLIHDAHLSTMHGGPQLTHSDLLRAYWITGARSKIRAQLRQCVRCTRFQGRPVHQKMAPLPVGRVTPCRPFNVVGVDYAGPFPVRASRGHGHKATKGYVAVFVCMVTRAVHLEVVADCTTKTFLMAFDRFTSRRGLCSVVYSDNGTTFKGASTELNKLFAEASDFSKAVAAAVAADGVRWTFIPPRAPHFGGLWEAAVKSFKHHLRRVVGEASLTYEEFSTLASRIEACLNSRPLSPLSCDPADVAALTTGHFLVGSALRARPEPPSPGTMLGGTQRWDLLCQMRNHFWARWRREVIHQLQQRSKWLGAQGVPAVGDLVLITEDLQPPLHWPLARVDKVHPGPDGLVRVLTLRTAGSQLQRPVHRVVRLPIDVLAVRSHAELGRPVGLAAVAD